MSCIGPPDENLARYSALAFWSDKFGHGVFWLIMRRRRIELILQRQRECFRPFGNKHENRRAAHRPAQPSKASAFRHKTCRLAERLALSVSHC